MEQLNFPNYAFTLKNRENKTYIVDLIRKKNLLLTPEEWVRQHCLHFLISELGYPKSLINVEKQIKINGQLKRYDIVVYSSQGDVHILVECKAPSIAISQNTFDQIAQYNMTLNSNFLMLSNGKEHYFCVMDFEKKSYKFIKELPKYKV
ncbi:type I restriction enzyme HsdR N-terminal domain-containing protein [Flavobacteriaceae bacterium]|nr:type I restriction enzyme HsdR N-terminal domain-containing protein [Flavobacteriaceae bacterium]MDB4067547.1 type I restriction enzyme HsdR N-terminal domain-containing protein [Flavobacteriaceae bacterium]MDB9988999.1 type I restriction enzyme HsdR N-terminal domain-containing protein [Flavobacteriaceae bacterium]